MPLTEAASHLGFIAVLGGTLSAGTNTFLEDLLLSLTEKQPLDLPQSLTKSLLISCTGGLVVSIIFYAFALYGWPQARWTPSQLILIFALYLGLVHPVIGLILKKIHSRVVANQS